MSKGGSNVLPKFGQKVLINARFRAKMSAVKVNAPKKILQNIDSEIPEVEIFLLYYL